MKKLTHFILFLSLALILCAGGCGTFGSSSGQDTDGSGQSRAAANANAALQDLERQGEHISLAVIAPEGNGLAADQDYLPATVQGGFVSTLRKYSAIQVLDRLNLDRVIRDNESGVYQDEDSLLQLGQVANVNHALTGSITKTTTGYALQIQVAPTTKEGNAATRASYSGTCTVEELDNFSAINKASLELLTQLGISLSDKDKQELSGAAAVNEVQAQTALARGITTQKSGGTVVETLSYYVQSASYDPTLTEAASRLNILTADITSGSMGENIRNDIQWRKQWTDRLTEAEQFYADYVKQPAPYYLVYDANLEQGEVNYTNETVTISGITVDLVPVADWFNAAGNVIRVVNVVRDGLMATGRAEEWGLNWPRNSVGPNPFGGRGESLAVVIELLNDEGVTIGSEHVTLSGGWDVEWSENSLRRLIPHLRGPQGLQFGRVNANLITARLSVRIASIDGADAETAANTRGINILREADYAQLPEVIAKLDSRSITKFMADTDINSSGVITAYKRDHSPQYVKDGNSVKQVGGDGDIVIPPSVFGLPVTEIGEAAFTEVKKETMYTDSGPYTYTTYKGKGLTSLTIPHSVTAIGDHAFRGNQLTSVVIGNGVTRIGREAFNNHQLTSITIPANVDLGEQAFNSAFKWLIWFFPDWSFAPFYSKNGKQAGTYTRPKAGSGKWTYMH
jgi:hypothetical protein